MFSAAPPIITGSEENRPTNGNQKSGLLVARRPIPVLPVTRAGARAAPAATSVPLRPGLLFRAPPSLNSPLLSYTALGSCVRRRATWRPRARTILVFFLFSLSLLARANFIRIRRLLLLTRRLPLHARWRPLLACALLLRASSTRMPASCLHMRASCTRT